jgi:hypothetical protein
MCAKQILSNLCKIAGADKVYCYGEGTSHTLVGAISQMVLLGSLTQVLVFKLQHVTPGQSIDVNINTII